ncbi:unnamed protein product [Lymnaea stagnalis]|uniref:Methyltransferase type 11 domain-containing protein n=1 Tax=Lymnaea stagnalis TaxID=6523 RepID=A0AAV2HWX6_LYMST
MMAELDAELHSMLLYYGIPSIILCYIVYQTFSLRRAKLRVEAFFFNLICGWVHRKFCNKEKTLLFDQLQHLKQQSPNRTFKVLEIGVGSGMNFKYYPRGTEVTCVDPNPFHEQYVIKNLRKAQKNLKLVSFIKGFAENMPQVESNAYDVVLCTLTLCSVRQPAAVLQEVKRVLKPGGAFFYLEHVAAQKGSFIRRVQDKLQYIWPKFSGGCNINRETWTFLDKSGFTYVDYSHYSVNTWLAFFARPCLYGSATK